MRRSSLPLLLCSLALALACNSGPQAEEPSEPDATAGSGTSLGGAAAGSSAVGGSSGGAGVAGSAGSAPIGGSAVAGSGSAGGSSGATGGIDPVFKLLWRDEFDGFDSGRWIKATHTFEENLARFTVENAVVEGGLLKLRVTNVPNGEKPYSAAEVYTTSDFTFGRFEARIKFCAGSGMVSSLFTYKQDVQESWQEIDVEHLGYLPKSIQYNLISGTLANRKYQPKVVTMPYSPTTEFHDYAIEWRPDSITFYVDGVQSHRDVQPNLRDAAKLRMNVWPTNNEVTSFAGKLNPDAIPCEAQYDWVSVYAYQP